jgi:hypothetical protein
MNHFRFDGINLGSGLARQFPGIDRGGTDAQGRDGHGIGRAEHTVLGLRHPRKVALALNESCRFTAEDRKYHY